MELVVDFLEVWDGWTTGEIRRALRDAAANWKEEVVALLLERMKFDVEAVQEALAACIDHARGPLTMYFGKPTTKPAVGDPRQGRVVCRLVDAGAGPDGNLRSVPLLHAAVMSVHPVIIPVASGSTTASGSEGEEKADDPPPVLQGALRGLLEKGANPNIRNSTNGKTALHVLLGRRGPMNQATVTLRLEFLLQHGASPEIPDNDGEMPLHAVAHTGTPEQLQLCLAYCADPEAAIRAQTSHGESLLHFAAAGGKRAIVEFLLDRGLQVNATNANGWTPLICALMPTNVKWISSACSVAGLLLERGANAQMVTDEGWTPLHALASYVVHASKPDSTWPDQRRDDVAPLVKDLILRGTPLDSLSNVLRSSSVTGEGLCDIWGVRMRDFAVKGAVTLAEGGCQVSVCDQDTTAMMWAYRNGALDIFDAVLEHWRATWSGNWEGRS